MFRVGTFQWEQKKTNANKTKMKTKNIGGKNKMLAWYIFF